MITERWEQEVIHIAKIIEEHQTEVDAVALQTAALITIQKRLMDIDSSLTKLENTLDNIYRES